MAVAARGQRLLDGVLHLRRQVGVGQRRRLEEEGGVRLQRQVVGGEVRRAEGRRRRDVGARLLERLPGQGVHQVEVGVVEVLQGKFDGVPRLVRVVDAPEGGEVARIEALHADGKTVDAGGAVAGKAARLGGAGVGFQRDFGARQQSQSGAHGGEQGVDRFGREQARRAAADEDAGHAPAPHQRQGRLQVGDQRVQIVRFTSGTGGLVAVEVAVRALLQAPRQVHVQRQRRQRAELQRARAEKVRRGVGGGVQTCHTSCSSARSCTMARARWLWRFLVSASSSATVACSSGIHISGS